MFQIAEPRKNPGILESRKLELLCLAKIAEGNEVSLHFQITSLMLKIELKEIVSPDLPFYSSSK